MLRSQGVSDQEIAVRFLEMDKAKVQGMSQDELAMVITSPEFEHLPSELQDAYVERMLG